MSSLDCGYPSTTQWNINTNAKREGNFDELALTAPTPHFDHTSFINNYTCSWNKKF